MGTTSWLEKFSAWQVHSKCHLYSYLGSGLATCPMKHDQTGRVGQPVVFASLAHLERLRVPGKSGPIMAGLSWIARWLYTSHHDHFDAQHFGHCFPTEGGCGSGEGRSADLAKFCRQAAIRMLRHVEFCQARSPKVAQLDDGAPGDAATDGPAMLAEPTTISCSHPAPVRLRPAVSSPALFGLHH